MEIWPRIHTALVTRGFKQVQGRGFACYEGELQVGADLVGVRLTFSDEHLQEMPELQLIARPTWLPALCAHLSPEPFLSLCYPGRTTSHLDPYTADEHAMWILDEAQKQLQELRTKKGAIEDVLGEFHSYWLGQRLLLDVPLETSPKNIWYCKLAARHGGGFLITEVTKQAAYDGMGLVEAGTWKKIDIYFAELAALPAVQPDQAWPPKNLHDLKRWFEGASSEALKELKNMIGVMFDRKSRSGIIIYRTKGNTWFGVSIELPAQVFKPKTHHKKHGYVSLALGEKYGVQTELTRWEASRIDADYIVTRNLPEGTHSLAGKNILLIGCGTIGGYLSDAIMRLGAGLGGGKLTLIDKDTYSAGNIGRHRLPLSMIGLSKAHAMADDLRRSLPWVNVESIHGSVLDMMSLRLYDMVIDATGYEPLALALNERFLSGEIKLIVYSWILGYGVAVQTFVSDRKTKGMACRRCLNASDDKTAFFPELPEKIMKVMGRGCDAPYIPYSLAPSMAAAALAVTTVMAANQPKTNGKFGPNFRTQMLDDDARAVKTKTVNKLKKCPACSQ